jgi:hypothetical protein
MRLITGPLTIVDGVVQGDGGNDPVPGPAVDLDGWAMPPADEEPARRRRRLLPERRRAAVRPTLPMSW